MEPSDRCKVEWLSILTSAALFWFLRFELRAVRFQLLCYAVRYPAAQRSALNN
jgi:hypothetical protein